MALFLCLGAASVRSADIIWTNVSGGIWGTAANWSPSQVPGAGDTAWITNNGTYTVTLNAAAAAGSLRLGGAAGTQTLNHTAGTLTLGGAGSSSTQGVYTLAGGTLTGSGVLTLAGPFNWTSGSLGSSGTTLQVWANGGMNWSGSVKYLSGGLLANGGVATWSAGQVQLGNGAALTNLPGSTVDLAADGSALMQGTGGGSFANAGLLRKSAGSATSTVNVSCANYGAVQVNSGTLSLVLTNSSGSFAVASNATLSIGGGNAILSAAASLDGPGNLTIASGTITNNGTFSLQGTNTFSGGTFSLNGPCQITNGVWMISSGTLALDGSGTLMPAKCQFSGGYLFGSQNMTLSGPMVWAGGTLGNAAASFTLTANGGVVISNSTRSFAGGTLVNAGAGMWLGGQVTCGGTAVFLNAPGATFDLQGTAYCFASGGGSAQIVNAGLLRRTNSLGSVSINVPCANSGVVEVDSGVLALTMEDSSGEFMVTGTNLLSLNGTATLSASASFDGAGNLAFTGGNITNYGTFGFQGTSTFSGGNVVMNGACVVTNGAFAFAGGKVLFNGSGVLSPNSLSLSGGVLQGNMLVSVAGATAWTGGTLGSTDSSLILWAKGSLAISNTVHILAGGTLINGGIGAWSGGQVTATGTAVFSNAPGASFSLAADGASFMNGGGSPVVANGGSFAKSGGLGQSTINVPCANSGAVSVDSGILALTLTDGGGSFAVPGTNLLSLSGTAVLGAATSIEGFGNLTVAGGAITNYGSYRVQGTNSFTGGTLVQAGLCQVTNGLWSINGGTVLWSGAGVLSPAGFSLAAGMLSGNGLISLNGPLAWTGGTLGAAGSGLVVMANGGLSISGNLKYLSGGTLVNTATAVWSAGQVTCTGTAVFSNAPSGVLDLQGSGTYSFSTASGAPWVVNSGTIRKTTSSGASTINTAFRNLGTVESDAGTLGFGQAFLQESGQTFLNGGGLSFSQTAQFRGGLLTGAGTITGSLSNNATVSPGNGVGLLTVSGSYTEGPNAHLQVVLAGTSAGSSYDQLSVGAAAKLAGALEVAYGNGFTPVVGNVFSVVSCGTRSGAFSSLTAPTNNLGTVYTAKAVLVEPGNASPTVQLTLETSQLAGHGFLVRGAAVDPDGSVTNLTLLLDTNVLASANGAVAQIAYSTDYPGALTFTALATDNKGAQGGTNVTVSVDALPLLVLDPVGFQTNRSFKLLMLGETGTNYQVLGNDTLADTNWQVLGAMQSTNGIWRFYDTTASNYTRRLYRARQY
jgi:hypothetical protein